MRNILYIILFLTACSFNSNQQEISVLKIEINYVELEVTTPIKVSCDKFYDYFGKINNIQIESSLEIGDFISKINELKNKGEVYKGSIDSRGQIVLQYSNGKKIKYCIGYYLTQIDGVVYENTEEFQNYIVNKLEAGF